MKIDQTLYTDTKKVKNKTQDTQTKVKEESFEDDLDAIIKEEGEDEFLRSAMDEMEQLLESETSLDSTDIKQEGMDDKNSFVQQSTTGISHTSKHQTFYTNIWTILG